MPGKTMKVRRAVSQVSLATRHHGPDDPRLPDLRRDLRAAVLEQHVAEVVAAAPPLTPEQRDRIVAILRGTPSASVGGGS